QTICWVIRIKTSKIPNFFVDVRQYLRYASSWLSRPIQLIFKVIRIPTSKMPKNFVDVCQDLVYAASCPSRPVQPILKGDPDYDLKNAKFFYGRASRPWLCIQLALASTIIFWVIRIPTSKMPNFFVDVRQDLVYVSGWPTRHFQPILKVKRAPKRAYHSFRRFLCANSNNFLGDLD
uniref:Uncharacterized protein n=1 Tax=Solanum lycopersicum TaxID=4081 RepID=A0A3Q7IZW6_SOLLC